MSRKKPGLTQEKYFELIGLLFDMSDRLCTEYCNIGNAYSLSNPPKRIRNALRSIDKARAGILDCRLLLEDRFFEENPDYPGTLGRDAGESEKI